jgi:hypothetical protein
VTPSEDIINDLESLVALFRDYNAVSKRGAKPTVPMDCFKLLVTTKLQRIEDITKTL